MLPLGHFPVGERKHDAMTDIHEKEISDQIDRELASSDGLVALVLCLAVAAGLMVAGVTSIVGAAG